MDLDIDEGAIVVREAASDVRLATYVIDPSFAPKTRSVELLPAGITLWVDSDAVAFRVEGRGVDPELFNNARVPLATARKQRVVALYPDGREEIIYDEVPTERGDHVAASGSNHVEDTRMATGRDRDLMLRTVLVLLLLGLAGLAPHATPRTE